MIVEVGVEATNQYEVMKHIAALAEETGFVKESQAFLRALLEREKEGTTGFGHGVAIPHGKCPEVEQTGVIICKLNQPVNWRAIDGESVELVIALAISPQHTKHEHLAMISKLARALMDDAFLQDIKKAHNPQAIKYKVMEVMT